MAGKRATAAVATRYVAFLRGINVGGHRVAMDRLRGLFEELGFAGVATFIASGNVVFDAAGDAPALERRIEGHLEKALGYEVATFLRTPAELAAIAAFRPFEEEIADGHTLHVAFLREDPGATAAPAMATFRTAMDDFRIQGRELYWLCRGKTTESLVSWPVVAKAAPMASTMRNMKTVRKLAVLYPPGPPTP